MKKKLVIIIPIIVVIVGVAILSSIMFLGWGPSRATEDDFSLTISIDQTTVMHGETIDVQVTLKNHTWRAQRISTFGYFIGHIPPGTLFNMPAPGGQTPPPTVRLGREKQRTIPIRIPDSLALGEHELSFNYRLSINRGRNSYREFEIWSNIIFLNIV
ncbi:MAG: hypothetical protein FWE16_01315 [Firmicutes bacterium]|nr:hypothetical protein [Bacillota bacterium]